MVKKKMFTSQEAADFLEIKEHELRVSRMDYPAFVRVGKRVYYELDALLAWKKRRNKVVRVTK